MRDVVSQQGREAFLQSEAIAVCAPLLLQGVTAWSYVHYVGGAFDGLEFTVSLFLVTRSACAYLAERSRSEEKVILYTVQQLMGPIFGLVIGLIVLAIWGGGAKSVFDAFIFANMASIIFGLLLTDFGRALPRLNRDILLGALKFGTPVMLAAGIAQVAVNIPRFVVANQAGIADAGVFNVGYGLGLRVASFAVMLVTAGAFPLVVRRLSEDGIEAAFSQLRANVLLVALTVCPTVFGLVAISHDAVDLLIAPGFREISYVVLPVSAIGGLMRYLRSHTTDQVFLLLKRPLYGAAISIVDLIFVIVAAIIGYLHYGVTGAAIAPMLAGGISYGISGVVAARVGFMLPIAKFARVIISAGVMGVAVALLPAASGYGGLSIKIGVGAIIYTVLLACLHPAERRSTMTLIKARVARKSD